MTGFRVLAVVLGFGFLGINLWQFFTNTSAAATGIGICIGLLIAMAFIVYGFTGKDLVSALITKLTGYNFNNKV
ncbi:hypothetical protein [Alteromonas halophila]|uniref:Uncharacterized protein n=1 Tax=Alteromonas halophila TaxID=516698 RepID=A0A918JR80_9ALTE|nr:hypothetical protein [Alteromonas halophila]GGW98029.1 hypothetical protein GCM10007391_35030 [Alteromonas halophila]